MARNSRSLNVIVTVSLALNLVLAYQLRRSREVVSALNDERSTPIGSIVPTFEVIGPDGHSLFVKYSDDSRPTILYVVTPTCVWCVRNHSAITALYNAEKDHYRFVGLSLTRWEVADDQALPFPVYMPTPIAAIAYHLGVTPQTLVVSTAGEVQNVWTGAYSGATSTAVMRYFGIALPEVAPAISPK